MDFKDQNELDNAYFNNEISSAEYERQTMLFTYGDSYESSGEGGEGDGSEDSRNAVTSLISSLGSKVKMALLVVVMLFSVSKMDGE